MHDVFATNLPVVLINEGDLRAALPARRTLRCRTVATGGFKQLNYVRDLPPLPVEQRFGPPDDAEVATPSETLLAALGSCLGSHIHADAAAGAIVVHSLEVRLEADVTASPMWDARGPMPGSVGFETIRVVVEMRADAPLETLQALVAHALAWSPVANTLHDPVHLELTLNP